MKKEDVAVQVNRTCKLEVFAFEERDIFGEYTEDHRYIDGMYQVPGRTEARWEDTLTFACPGCGKVGSIRCTRPKDAGGQRSWEIVAGSLLLDELPRLTLAPSIHCVGCCGWHGYLRNGVYETC